MTRNEEPMKSLVKAVYERNDANAGFLRDGADLAVVVVSDEDERSNGKSRKATKPEAGPRRWPRHQAVIAFEIPTRAAPVKAPRPGVTNVRSYSSNKRKTPPRINRMELSKSKGEKKSPAEIDPDRASRLPRSR